MSVPAKTLPLPAGTDVPANAAEAMQVAQFLTGTAMMPAHLRDDPAGIFSVMLIARALDIPMATAFRNIINMGDGSVGMSATLMQALVIRARHGLYVMDSSLTSATVRATRPGIGHDARGWDTVTFTVEDAARAQLIVRHKDGTISARSREGKPKSWELYTEDMLIWRAIARAARRYFPDVLMGMVHTPDELGADVDAEGNPVQVRREAVRVEVDEAVPGFVLRIRHADTLDALRAVLDDITAAGHADTITADGRTLTQAVAVRKFVLTLPDRVEACRTRPALSQLFDEACKAGAEAAEILPLFEARERAIVSGATVRPRAEAPADGESPTAVDSVISDAAPEIPEPDFATLPDPRTEVDTDTEHTPRRAGVLRLAADDLGGTDAAAAALVAAFGRPVETIGTARLQEWLMRRRREHPAPESVPDPDPAPRKRAAARKPARKAAPRKATTRKATTRKGAAR